MLIDSGSITSRILTVGGADSRGFVNAADNRGMRVGINDAGRDMQPGPVNLQASARRGKVLADSTDSAVSDHQIGVFKNAAIGGRPDRCIADDDRRGSLRGGGLFPCFDVGSPVGKGNAGLGNQSPPGSEKSG